MLFFLCQMASWLWKYKKWKYITTYLNFYQRLYLLRFTCVLNALRCVLGAESLPASGLLGAAVRVSKRRTAAGLLRIAWRCSRCRAATFAFSRPFGPLATHRIRTKSTLTLGKKPHGFDLCCISYYMQYESVQYLRDDIWLNKSKEMIKIKMILNHFCTPMNNIICN